LPAY